jgi:hypothetical protein
MFGLTRHLARLTLRPGDSTGGDYCVLEATNRMMGMTPGMRIDLPDVFITNNELPFRSFIVTNTTICLADEYHLINMKQDKYLQQISPPILFTIRRVKRLMQCLRLEGWIA